MFGIPIVRKLSGRATKMAILSTAYSKLFEALGFGTGRWGIYKAGRGSDQPSFAQNAVKVALSTPVLNTTIGKLIGGEPSETDPVVDVDSVVMLDSRSETQVSDYRIEMGGFVSYNKVPIPESVAVVLSKGSTLSERMAFINWLDANVEATTVYDVVVPEKVYKDMTLESYEILRDAEKGGTALIDARCVFRKIRTVAPIYSNKDASTENAQSGNDTPTEKPEQVQAEKTDDSVVGRVTNAVNDAAEYVTEKAKSIRDTITDAFQSTTDKVNSVLGSSPATGTNPDYWN